MSDARLRSGTTDDIETLRAIDKAARARYAAFPPLGMNAERPPIAAERFAVGETIVAERVASVVGFALLQPLDGLLYLGNISVRPEAGGHGVGAALLEAVVDRAHAQGLPAVTLTTFKAPPWNGPWFGRFGFAPMPDDRIGPGLRAVVTRQAQVLDPGTRETLWRQIDA